MYMEGEPFVRRPSVHSSTLPIEPLPAVRVHGTMSHKPGIKIRFRLLTLSWNPCHPPVSLNCCRTLAKKWKKTTSLKPQKRCHIKSKLTRIWMAKSQLGWQSQGIVGGPWRQVSLDECCPVCSGLPRVPLEQMPVKSVASSIPKWILCSLPADLFSCKQYKYILLYSYAIWIDSVDW